MDPNVVAGTNLGTAIACIFLLWFLAYVVRWFIAVFRGTPWI